jgi:hypothetical protein
MARAVASMPDERDDDAGGEYRRAAESGHVRYSLRHREQGERQGQEREAGPRRRHEGLPDSNQAKRVLPPACCLVPGLMCYK